MAAAPDGVASTSPSRADSKRSSRTKASSAAATAPVAATAVNQISGIRRSIVACVPAPSTFCHTIHAIGARNSSVNEAATTSIARRARPPRCSHTMSTAMWLA